MLNIGGVEVASLDLALGLVLLVSALVGIWRGLVFEVLSLLGWVVAYVAAQAFAAAVAGVLPIGAPGSGLNYAAAFAATFLLALVAWSLAARLARLLIRATPLSTLDRGLGALFGLLRGGVLLLVVATLAAMTPAHRSSAWQQARVARGLDAALVGLKPMLPADLGRHLP